MSLLEQHLSELLNEWALNKPIESNPLKDHSIGYLGSAIGSQPRTPYQSTPSSTYQPGTYQNTLKFPFGPEYIDRMVAIYEDLLILISDLENSLYTKTGFAQQILSDTKIKRLEKLINTLKDAANRVRHVGETFELVFTLPDNNISSSKEWVPRQGDLGIYNRNE